MYELRKVTLDDVKYFDKNARQADKDEVFLLTGRTIGEVLTDTPNLEKDGNVWVVNNKIVAIFGVTKWDKDNIIWMLATNDFDKYTNIFKRDCRKVFKDLIINYDYLYNYVHSKHYKAIRWLKWLGANILEPEPIGLNGELFCKFEMRNK